MKRGLGRRYFCSMLVEDESFTDAYCDAGLLGGAGFV